MARRRPVGTSAAIALALLIPLVGATAMGAAALETAEDPVLLAAGDIAVCGSSGDDETAAILDAEAGTIAALGDLAYEDGTAEQFATCYDPSWGRHRDRTFPTPGNHEYNTSGAAPYYAYFAERAGPNGHGYYSYDLGAWHIVSLNANCTMITGGCGPGSPQEAWLRADLEASTALCTLAYWHQPPYTSGTTHGPSEQMRTLIDLLHAHDADVLLNGHEHHYERFAPQTPDRIASTSGIRAFVVGTGGRPASYPFGQPPAPNSEVRMGGVRGILKLTLRAASYDWQFLPVAGQTFTDSGTGECHGETAPDSNPPTAPSALVATSPSVSRVDLSWTPGADDVGIAGYRIFRDGAEVGTTSATTWADLTVAAGTTYTYHVVAYDAALNASPTSNTATVTTQTGDRTLTITPSADATIESANPTANFGGATTVQADANPVRAFLLRFGVTGIGGGAVITAKLRLHVTNGSNRGGDFRSAATSWMESTVNWQNAPAAGALVGSMAAVSAGTWYDIALAAGTVIQDGEVAFRVTSPSSDGVDYNSREDSVSLRPQLVLTVSDPAADDREPPTKPTGLVATPAATGAVDLSWAASADNVRVSGYRILRNGSEIISTSATAYTDTAVTPATTYSYEVVAVDAAGNQSAPSDVVTVTTASAPPPPPPPPPPAPRTLTFTAAADATIVAASPSANTGSAMTVEDDNSPVKNFLLRFAVNGVGSGTITAAKLRLHVTNGSDRGGDFRATSNAWTESAVTWGSAPAVGALVGSLEGVAAGAWQELQLAAGAVAGDGPVNLRVSSPSSDGAAYDSREAGAALAPQLILTVADPAVQDVSPPTAPSPLAAAAISPTRVDLSWAAATDDVRVAGYRVFRAGAELATTSETTYTDTAVLPGTSYAYHVVAYDDSGKVSPPSNTAGAITPLGDRTLTFTPTDDAYVLRNTPAANTGTAWDLHVDNSPVKGFLLKFDVSGIGAATVTGAKLRLHVLDGSKLGGLFSTASSSWTQSSVTWANAPAAGPRVATLNAVAAGTWRDIPLAASAVTADGAVSFRVDSTSSDGADYDSKEAGPALAPQLILTVSALPAFVWNALR